MKIERIIPYALLLAAFAEGPSVLAQNSATVGMVSVSAGPFQMGDALDVESDAIPTGTVYVSGFFIDTNLVSSNFWEPVLKWAMTNGYGFDETGYAIGGNYPIDYIDWYDAIKWCNARSQKAGLAPVYFANSALTTVYKTGENTNVYVNWTNTGYRLPTEAEWEKAARGGLTGDRFPWGNTINSNQANYVGDPYNTAGNSGYTYDLAPPGYNAMWYTNTTFPASEQGNSSPVGYYPPNAYGINDMAGNEFEWCWDWYSNSYAAFPLTDPHGPTNGTSRVARGGAWNQYAYESRSAFRGFQLPGTGNQDFVHSFRAVLPQTGFATITVQASPTNEGVATGGGIVFLNTLVTNIATPSAGCEFVNWTSNSIVVSTNTTYIFEANASETLVANFALITYTVTVSASPAAGGTVSGGGIFLPGSTNTATATANPDFTFSNWTENGVVVSTSSNYSFIVNSNQSLVANFAPIIYTITLNASPAAGGAVSGGGAVDAGSIITVTATPSIGYAFADWSFNGSVISTSPNYTFTVSGNLLLTANFAPVNYTLTVGASPAAGGTVGGGGTFPYESMVTVTATPGADYQFANWSLNGIVVSTSSSYAFTLTNNETLVANFTPIIYLVTVGASPTNGGAVSGGGAFAAGTTNTVMATPSNGYTFSDWTLNGGEISASSNYTFTVNGNYALVANFFPIYYSLTVSASPAAGGSVTGTGTYPYDTLVTNTATANAGYLFLNWTVNSNVVSAASPYVFTLTNNENLVANFSINASANFTFTINNGSITITSYTGPGGAVTIPALINGLPVTSIGEEAFWNCASMTSVSIPASVANIGEEAFWNCINLGSITIPDGVTNIGMEAFSNCTGLTNVDLPDSVINIGDSAFDSCLSLGSVIIPNSVTNLGAGAFDDCFSLTNVIIGTGATAIRNGVFEGTSLVSVTIPNGVTSIGADAFDACTGLTSITIPRSVTSIGIDAFGFCPLTNVYFAGNAPGAVASAFSDDAATVYYLAGTMGWGSTFDGLPAVEWNPVIQTGNANFGVRSNKFGFTITGPANIPIIVQANTNLAGGAWTNLQSCTLTNGSIYFADPAWSGKRDRFYRISSSYP